MTELAQTPGEITTFIHDGRSLTIECGRPRIQLTVLTPQLVRVRLAPDGAFAPRRSWAVARADEEFAAVPFEVREDADALQLNTGTLLARIDKAHCHITFVDPHGVEFCADADGMSWRAIDHGRLVACDKQIAAGEHFYGFGERTGQLDKLSRRMINWATDPPWGL